MTLIHLTATYDEKGIELDDRLLADDMATLREYAQDAVQHINADVVEVHVTAGNAAHKTLREAIDLALEHRVPLTDATQVAYMMGFVRLIERLFSFPHDAQHMQQRRWEIAKDLGYSDADANKLSGLARSEPVFVIAGETDDEDGTLYWSNDDGWGHLSTATVFTDYERAVDHLPVNFSLDQPPRWVQLPIPNEPTGGAS